MALMAAQIFSSWTIMQKILYKTYDQKIITYFF